MTKRLQRVSWVAAVLVAAALVCGVHRWCASRRARARIVAERVAERAAAGIASDGACAFQALPPILPHSPAAARLGFRLFTDRRLGRTSRRTCAACHLLNAGGSDSALHGGVLTRPFTDAVFARRFLHDGSATNFAGAVRAMASGGDFCGVGPLEGVARRLAADTEMTDAFRRVYGGYPAATNIVLALEQFARTQITTGRVLDLYLGGQEKRFGAAERRGMAVFEKRCLSCHDGLALGGRRVADGRNVARLRGLTLRRAWLAREACTDLGAALAHMDAGPLDDAERADLLLFLKTL